ncbi:MAG: formyltransferase family protein [Cyanobacteria bacterium P01_H01_bin.74]
MVEPRDYPALNQANTRRVKVILCGYGHLGSAVLNGLLKASHCIEITGVLRWNSTDKGQLMNEPECRQFKQIVDEHQLNDIVCSGVNGYQFSALLQKLQPHFVLVASWGEIFKPHLLEKETPLVINCHPSFLPKHRGPNPYASVILQDESYSGVTFHKMTRRIDGGDIILQDKFPLESNDTGFTVRKKCAALAEPLTVTLAGQLKAHINQQSNKQSELPAMKQPAAEKTYYPQLRENAGQINWQESPDTIYRQMRGLFPWMITYGIFPLSFSGLSVPLKLLFFKPRFHAMQLVVKNQACSAGRILSISKKSIVVGLNDSKQIFEVSNYRVSVGKKVLPIQANTLFIRLFFPQGKHFICWPEADSVLK